MIIRLLLPLLGLLLWAAPLAARADAAILPSLELGLRQLADEAAAEIGRRSEGESRQVRLSGFSALEKKASATFVRRLDKGLARYLARYAPRRGFTLATEGDADFLVHGRYAGEEPTRGIQLIVEVIDPQSAAAPFKTGVVVKHGAAVCQFDHIQELQRAILSRRGDERFKEKLALKMIDVFDQEWNRLGVPAAFGGAVSKEVHELIYRTGWFERFWKAYGSDSQIEWAEGIFSRSMQNPAVQLHLLETSRNAAAFAGRKVQAYMDRSLLYYIDCANDYLRANYAGRGLRVDDAFTLDFADASTGPGSAKAPQVELSGGISKGEAGVFSLVMARITQKVGGKLSARFGWSWLKRVFSKVLGLFGVILIGDEVNDAVKGELIKALGKAVETSLPEVQTSIKFEVAEDLLQTFDDNLLKLRRQVARGLTDFQERMDPLMALAKSNRAVRRILKKNREGGRLLMVMKLYRALGERAFLDAAKNGDLNRTLKLLDEGEVDAYLAALDETGDPDLLRFWLQASRPHFPIAMAHGLHKIYAREEVDPSFMPRFLAQDGKVVNGLKRAFKNAELQRWAAHFNSDQFRMAMEIHAILGGDLLRQAASSGDLKRGLALTRPEERRSYLAALAVTRNPALLERWIDNAPKYFARAFDHQLYLAMNPDTTTSTFLSRLLSLDSAVVLRIKKLFKTKEAQQASHKLDDLQFLLLMEEPVEQLRQNLDMLSILNDKAAIRHYLAAVEVSRKNRKYFSRRLEKIRAMDPATRLALLQFANEASVIERLIGLLQGGGRHEYVRTVHGPKLVATGLFFLAAVSLPLLWMRRKKKTLPPERSS